MTIYYQGGQNPAAQQVPGLFINVQAPPAAPLPGAPSNILGLVGSGSWGPTNSPVIFSDESSGSIAFGTMKNRKYDLMTQARAAIMQGVSDMRGVRITDGTDAAASVAILTNCLTLTAKYTGTDGNGIQATTSPGTASGTSKIAISMPNRTPEVYDNVAGSGNALWLALAAAINSGQGSLRGPSALVVATAGVGTTAIAAATYTLSGGADGATSVTATHLVGSDATPRTGMYALRGAGTAVFLLADCDASTSWAAQIAFAKSESTYAVMVSPSGDTISNFGTVMNSAGIDDPWGTVVFGDWVYMLDTINNLTRLVSPQGFKAGCKVYIGPHNSTLNKPLYGIVGTQKSFANQLYSNAELGLITAARGDVIVMQADGGNYPAMKFGRNSSSDVSRRQDTYTTMTNYLASSLNAAAGLGKFVGALISPTQMREAKSVIGGFLQNEWDAGRIGNSDGTLPYSVQIDAGNNPQSAIVLGIEKARVMVQYLSVLEYLIVDLTGGQTVQIASQLPIAA